MLGQGVTDAPGCRIPQLHGGVKRNTAGGEERDNTAHSTARVMWECRGTGGAVQHDKRQGGWGTYVASMGGLVGLAEPSPVGDHFTLYTAFLCDASVDTAPDLAEAVRDQMRAVPSSDAEASSVLAGFQEMAFTSSVWPVNTRVGDLSPIVTICTVLSDEHVANCESDAQSTSRMGAV